MHDHARGPLYPTFSHNATQIPCCLPPRRLKRPISANRPPATGKRRQESPSPRCTRVCRARSWAPSCRIDAAPSDPCGRVSRGAVAVFLRSFVAARRASLRPACFSPAGACKASGCSRATVERSRGWRSPSSSRKHLHPERFAQRLRPTRRFVAPLGPSRTQDARVSAPPRRSATRSPGPRSTVRANAPAGRSSSVASRTPHERRIGALRPASGHSPRAAPSLHQRTAGSSRPRSAACVEASISLVLRRTPRREAHPSAPAARARHEPPACPLMDAHAGQLHLEYLNGAPGKVAH